MSNKNRDEIAEQLRARKGVEVGPEVIEAWLHEHNFKEMANVKCVDWDDPICHSIWVDETSFWKNLDPFQLTHHPIDKKRIKTLSDLWDHKTDDQASDHFFLVCLYYLFILLTIVFEKAAIH